MSRLHQGDTGPLAGWISTAGGAIGLTRKCSRQADPRKGACGRRLQAIVARLFTPETRAEAPNVLEGSLDRLRELIASAKRGYRDVLAWAEYAEELGSATWRLPTAEQARIRAADRAQYVAWLEAHRE